MQINASKDEKNRLNIIAVPASFDRLMELRREHEKDPANQKVAILDFQDAVRVGTDQLAILGYWAGHAKRNGWQVYAVGVGSVLPTLEEMNFDLFCSLSKDRASLRVRQYIGTID